MVSTVLVDYYNHNMTPLLSLLSILFGFYPRASLHAKYVVYSISFFLVTSAAASYALYIDYAASFHKKSLRMKTNTAIVVTTMEIFFLILSSGVVIIEWAFTRKHVDMSRLNIEYLFRCFVRLLLFFFFYTYLREKIPFWHLFMEKLKILFIIVEILFIIIFMVYLPTFYFIF